MAQCVSAWRWCCNSCINARRRSWRRKKIDSGKITHRDPPNQAERGTETSADAQMRIRPTRRTKELSRSNVRNRIQWRTNREPNQSSPSSHDSSKTKELLPNLRNSRRRVSVQVGVCTTVTSETALAKGTLKSAWDFTDTRDSSDPDRKVGIFKGGRLELGVKANASGASTDISTKTWAQRTSGWCGSLNETKILRPNANAAQEPARRRFMKR